MYRIRSGRLSDYPIIRQYDEFMGDRRLDLQAGELRVADAESSEAIGYLRISPKGFLNWPFVAYLCVKSEFRNHGVGRQLIEHAIQDDRYVRLYISTEANNIAMQSLLKKVEADEIGYADQLNFSNERELFYRLK
ncbi:GNAT family N-acetyltransferase [uncultured Roseibium sp.]|uniref:GNAT family N-acetyltransferase n=1 Tax=uncultured Roseibium sp. TaxID=1936171 RepID=UPI0026193061|nr:GNAT family N-acetyltransferase [uncultured Roseibium sp.]